MTCGTETETFTHCYFSWDLLRWIILLLLNHFSEISHKIHRNFLLILLFIVLFRVNKVELLLSFLTVLWNKIVVFFLPSQQYGNEKYTCNALSTWNSLLALCNVIQLHHWNRIQYSDWFYTGYNYSNSSRYIHKYYDTRSLWSRHWVKWVMTPPLPMIHHSAQHQYKWIVWNFKKE